MGQISGLGAALDVADIPVMATTVIVGSGIAANAAAVATIPARPAMTAYVTGFQITASGATAASVAAAVLAGVAGGPVDYSFTFPAGVGVSAMPLSVAFKRAIPAAAMNTAITLALPAGGAGNVSASVVLQGFYL